MTPGAAPGAEGAGQEKVPTYQTLSGAAEEAVRTMSEAILDRRVPDEHRFELDAASKVLWHAVRVHRGWERTILASPTRPTLGLKLPVDLGPIAATCATCGNQALIVGSQTGPGLAICRFCSFDGHATLSSSTAGADDGGAA